MPWLGENGVGGFAEELRGIRTVPPEGFKKFQKRSCGTHIPGSSGRQSSPSAWLCPEEQRHGQGCGWGRECAKQAVDGCERDVCENVGRPGAQVAVKVSGCLGAGGTPGVLPGAGCYFGNAVAVRHCVVECGV
jgi:hypothetical protein